MQRPGRSSRTPRKSRRNTKPLRSGECAGGCAGQASDLRKSARYPRVAYSYRFREICIASDLATIRGRSRTRRQRQIETVAALSQSPQARRNAAISPGHVSGFFLSVSSKGLVPSGGRGHRTQEVRPPWQCPWLQRKEKPAGTKVRDGRGLESEFTNPRALERPFGSEWSAPGQARELHLRGTSWPTRRA